MAHLDVYPLPGGARRGYMVDVQANLLSGLATRVVVPLMRPKAGHLHFSLTYVAKTWMAGPSPAITVGYQRRQP